MVVKLSKEKSEIEVCQKILFKPKIMQKTAFQDLNIDTANEKNDYQLHFSHSQHLICTSHALQKYHLEGLNY